MRSVRIGLLVPLSGSAGLWAPSAEACGRLAVSELNHASGILRRPIELLVIDAGETGRSAGCAAREAVDDLAVDGLVGMVPSYARDPIAAATRGRVPFVYTPQFEGLAPDGDVMTTGETADELMAPAIQWLSEFKRARRFFLCGNDYIWPRSSLQIAKRLIARFGGTVTGECYAPVGVHDFDEMLDRIKATRSDVVVPVFLGFDCIAFSRAFCAAGLSRHVLRFSPAFDETIVYGLDSSETENLFVASSYFASLRSRNNGAFLERYYTAFGDNPPPANGYGESCYEGIHALAALIERAASFDARHLKRFYGRTLQGRTARGVEAQPVVGGRHPVYLAELDGYDFAVVASR
ncbi:substrate-binding domain-containing protein [Bradyrhizobium ontarionense]|uniref:Substrate-binding domain-containing protein n=1 Tax=Bradyrhizobium ontarionense TaxID=2898149 RepID=A0ABY3RFW0_9BRAD|nr:substrate-binding domain-containing protein [Bradyrhizobium sp. A19]UFZ05942.1 substrate-binding domain-containing protein [Bradyrhizobium sp. A19]